MKHIPKPPRKHQSPRDPRSRRGTLYVAVLGVAMIVAICGLCGLQLARLRLKTVQGTVDCQQARVLALSAVEHAVSMMDLDPHWRTTYAHDVEMGPWTLGDHGFRWRLLDEDGNLTDDASDPVWIFGIGRVGDAEWIARARARVDAGLPLEFLRTALHCSRKLTTHLGKNITVSGAPISTDGMLDNDAQIAGDAEAVTLTGSGTITGTVTVPVDKKGIPAAYLFDAYVVRARTLSFNGDIKRMVVSAEVNDYGAGLNVDGIYHIDTGGADLTISNARILGTMVIDAGDGTVTIGPRCLLEPYRKEFPTLIIKGAVEFAMNPVTLLREQIAGNLNPPGVPYAGQSNSDTADTYPTHLSGLVHVIGSVTIAADLQMNGCLVVQGTVNVLATSTIVHDPNLMFNPPRGYTSEPDNTGMIIEARSWSRQAGS